MKRLLSILLVCISLLTISVSAAESSEYKDVKPTDWYYEAITNLSTNNIITGTDEQTFSPHNTLTKGESIAMLTRTFITSNESNWDDILHASWKYAVDTGLIDKDYYPETELNLPISRYEFAEMLSSALNLRGYMSSPSLYLILDYGEKMPIRFRNAVYNCYIAGLLSGVDSFGTFMGDKTLTRAEAAVAIYRFVEPNSRVDFTGYKNYSKELSTFSTTYDASQINRSYNIALSASVVNEKIVESGAEFSFNSIVGNAGKDNGYKLATVISGGKYTQGYGGGVCQTSTTLFNAALLANMNITERHAHALKSAYVAPGYDATISSGALDLKFVNPYDDSIKIVGAANNGTVTFTIYGNENTVVPEINLNVTSSKGTYTLIRTADGIENYKTSSKYKN